MKQINLIFQVILLATLNQSTLANDNSEYYQVKK